MASAKIQIFEQFAELARVLGHAHRLELIEHVSQGERSVERLSELTGLSFANASQHLQLLRRGGFITSRREGKRVLYRLADGPILELLSALRHYAEHNRAEVRKITTDYFQRLDHLEPVSRDELVDRLRDGSVTLLDVRPQDEFALGHLPGAWNVPIGELEKRLADLPTNQEFVAYCRGPYCVLSFEAVAALRAKGYRIRRLEDGYPEWSAAGLPVERVSSTPASNPRSPMSVFRPPSSLSEDTISRRDGTVAPNERDGSPLLRILRDSKAPSVFKPENLLREGRRQRGLPERDVPEVCVLDPDGDFMRSLRRDGRGRLCPGWACYHSELFEFDLRSGGVAGVVGCAVGAPYAVLVAEQLFASGCRFLISITSAGLITELGDPPYVVLIERALRDEGTSAHYLPSSSAISRPLPTPLCWIGWNPNYGWSSRRVAALPFIAGPPGQPTLPIAKPNRQSRRPA